MDDQRQTGSSPPSRDGRSRFLILAAALVLIATATGFFLLPRLHPPAERETQDQKESRLFRGWPKPDIALVLSGQEYGYMQPCGCSEPQKGGLARRFNFIKTLIEGRKWPVLAADLGDVAQKSGPQAKIKYVYSMQALEKMNYTAVGIGEGEGTLPLFEALGEYALNSPKPKVLAANLNMNDFPGSFPYELVPAKDGVPSVGLVGIVGPTVAKVMAGQDPGIKFADEAKTLEEQLKALQSAKAELVVLLYQGFEEEAKKLIKKCPGVDVVLYLSREDEPSAQTLKIGRTLLVGVGHKGKHIGVVGANRTGNPNQPFEFRFQIVDLEPEYETPDGRDADNPIHALLQEYARKLKDENYLAKYPTANKHSVQVQFPGSTYIGSEGCKKCHEKAYEIWAASPHPHAYDTLVNKAKRPTLRQFDGECIECHVTGFTQVSGFSAANPVEKLKGVTCESCHGPCSLHKAKPEDQKIHEAINPWKHRARKDDRKDLNVKIGDMCQKCHDIDNDVHFDFEGYWEPKKIAHYTPKD